MAGRTDARRKWGSEWVFGVEFPRLRPLPRNRKPTLTPFSTRARPAARAGGRGHEPGAIIGRIRCGRGRESRRGRQSVQGDRGERADAALDGARGVRRALRAALPAPGAPHLPSPVAPGEHAQRPPGASRGHRDRGAGGGTGRASTAGSGTGPGIPTGRGLVIYFGGNAEEVSGTGVRGGRARPVVIGGVQLPRLRPQRGSTRRGRARRGRSRHPRPARRARGRRSGAHRRLRPEPRERGRGAARRGAAGTGRPPRLPLRQPEERRAKALPLRSGVAHAPAPLRLPRARAGHRRAPPRARRRTRPDRPVPHSRRLHDAWRGPKRWVLLPGADHNRIQLHPGYWPAIRDFLGSLDRAR